MSTGLRKNQESLIYFKEIATVFHCMLDLLWAIDSANNFSGTLRKVYPRDFADR